MSINHLSPAPDRYVPQLAFPAYSFVGGHWPHPHRHDDGHRLQVIDGDPLCQQNWSTHPTYLFGIDLFNHGYYWEAHEQWEALWHQTGKVGDDAMMLKGLIKLAAASLKLRVGQAKGVEIHCTNATRLFDDVARRAPTSHWYGLSLVALFAGCLYIQRAPTSATFDLALPVERTHLYCLSLELATW